MAIAAVDPELPGMMPVAERHRLGGAKVGRGDIGRAREADDAGSAAGDDGETSEQEQSYPRIGRGREDLGHPGWTRW